MALNFPQGVGNGTTWEDDCENIWIYDSTDDKWTIRPPAFDFPEVDPDSIWARNSQGQISPIRPGDELVINLDMGGNLGDINLTNFPTKT